MKKILFLLLAAATLNGCYKEKSRDESLQAGERHGIEVGHPEQLMQIICCSPTGTKPENVEKCGAIKASPGGAVNFSGTLTTAATSDATCTGLDDKPFWGRMD